ncbi:MAG: DUF1571 domain-containing protein [Candidatus Anammoximicrobium sp.]|nr:DUF1571 domain-containing protein [Candidatus Anammoximicrobium sp.]
MLKERYRGFTVGNLLAAAAVLLAGVCVADEPQRARDNLSEPVLRVASKAPAPKHPLDPALDIARNGLQNIRATVNDYTCTLVKREQIDGKLLDYEYIFVKIRNRKVADGKIVTPFSVYMYFLKPTEMKGREVMYVEGRNEEKMVAHEGGTAGKYLPTVWIRPNGIIAMRNQRYPLTEVGLENLVVKLIERGEIDKAAGRREHEVTFHEDAKVNGRTCTLLQIKNAQPSENLDFHLAQVFIDKDLNVPIRYVAYDFPAKAGDPLPVIEEYTYLNLKLNVGLTDKDFDHTNAQYKF